MGPNSRCLFITAHAAFLRRGLCRSRHWQLWIAVLDGDPGKGASNPVAAPNACGWHIDLHPVRELVSMRGVMFLEILIS